MDSLINPDEILDLIVEVGHTLLLCDVSVSQTPDPFYGIPAQKSVVSRPVRGYVVPEKISLIEIAGKAELKAGAYIAYISAEDLRQEDLTPQSQLSFEGTLYPIEYIQGIVNRGIVLLHKLRMLRPQNTVNQPSHVLR